MAVVQKEINSFDGTRIAYHIQTNKTRWFLVFLHGAGGDLKAWDRERDFFHSKGVSTLAIDLRGHGLSGRPAHFADYSLDHFATDIRHVLRHEGVKRYILVGHCFGGMVAMNYQKLFPNQARSYVFIDTTDRAPLALEALDHTPFLRGIVNLMLEHTSLHPRHFAHINYQPFVGTADLDPGRIASDIRHMSLKSWLFVYETMGEFNAVDVLGTIVQPALIIHGKKDIVFSPAVAADIKSHMREATLDLIPNANHIIVLNNPEELVTEIWKFLHAVRRKLKIRLRDGERSFDRWLRSLNSLLGEEEIVD